MKRHTFRPLVEELEKRDTPSVTASIMVTPRIIIQGEEAVVAGTFTPSLDIPLRSGATPGRIIASYAQALPQGREAASVFPNLSIDVVKPPSGGGGTGAATVGEGRNEYGPPVLSSLPPAGIDVALGHVSGGSEAAVNIATPDHWH